MPAAAIDEPFDALARDFERALRAELRRSAYTARNYMGAVRRFGAFLAADRSAAAITLRTLEALEAADFRAFLASRRDEGLSAPSLKLELSALRTFYRFLKKRRGVENDAIAAMRGPKQKERLPRPVAATAAAQLIDMASAHRAPWEAARDRAVLMLLYAAGLRISEALSLKWRDAPLGAAVRIHGKGGKWRDAPMLPVARAAVEAYRALCPYAPADAKSAAAAPLFFSARGKPLSARVVQLEMRRAARALGLPESATPHALRHAFATELLSASGDLRAVQELLGHSSIAATQRYAKVDAEGVMKRYRAAHPRALAGPRSKANS